MCKMLSSTLQRMTIVCRQRSIRRKVCHRDQSLRQVAEPATAVFFASITGSRSQIGAKSVTPIPISFDALSEDPVPLKGCVLWNQSGFMVRIMASATREIIGEGGCAHVKSKTLSVMLKSLDKHVFVLKHCNAHLSQHILRAIRCKSLLSAFPTKIHAYELKDCKFTTFMRTS